MIVFWIILALIVLLLAVILVRTAMFKPKVQPSVEHEKLSVNQEKAISNLQQLIRCRTVSNPDHSLEDADEFKKLVSLLPKLYPHVFAACDYQELPERELLFHWKGKKSGPDAEAAVLMAHYDVVAVDEKAWTHDPFAAEIKDGILWGRGTLDTKVTFNGVLTAADELIAQGFQPEEDIYMAFSGQEEINGPGATMAVDYFKKNNIKLSMVVDEGGAVVDNVFPGVSTPCALVGTAEKGMINMEYTAKSAGGHASAPKPHSPVAALAEAVSKVENNPMKPYISGPVTQMFNTLGRESTFLYRMIFANLWLFKGVLAKLTKKTGGDLNALMRTTVAFTMMNGSRQPNVIPPEAKVVSNIRINPNDSIQSVTEHIKTVINDPSITVSAHTDKFEPSPISTTECDGWKRVVNAIKGTWDNCLVSPYLMVQCSDSRHYRDISDKVYRFCGYGITAEERLTIHGNDEHIRLEEVGHNLEFYERLIRQC
ncbi:MAG: M20/M25/M40 family metallo-hydrolase [Eubacterium sp.]|nr:M20/M25/M40 family metallo-hydrolase [Eubacterium sp.]